MMKMMINGLTMLDPAYDPALLFNIAVSDELLENVVKNLPASVNKRNSAGVTPLMYAAKNGNVNRVEWLLKHRANPNIQSIDAVSNSDLPIDKGGNTALHYALFFGYNPNVVKIVALLINHGADMRIRNKSGDEPLHYLSQVQTIPDREQMFKDMIAHGTDVNAQGYKGNTIVHQIGEKNDFPWLDVLKRGYLDLVDFSLKNNAGKTPAQLADSLGHTDIGTLLRDTVLIKESIKKK